MRTIIDLIENLLGGGKYQINGEADIYESRADLLAALQERGDKMETVWYPSPDDSPEWATKIYYLRNAERERISDEAFVYSA